jgi:hypothetical protein
MAEQRRLWLDEWGVYISLGFTRLGGKSDEMNGLSEERQHLPDSSPGLDARRLENNLSTSDE